jgi:nitrate reductase gamma subunit
VGKLAQLLWDAVKAVFSWKIVLMVKTLFLDVLLQRRLYRRSQGRWLIHSLIFLPFVFRFAWGLIALVGSLWIPQWQGGWSMLDKNDPAAAFLFDLTGMMVIIGVCLALVRGFFADLMKVSGLPGQDRLALGLIAGIVLVGFILEGLRIAMTGRPGGSEYALVGFCISVLFSILPGLRGLYGYVWYVHAILTSAFIAYFPFSRLFHIIMAPLVLAMGAVKGHEHGKRGE